MQDSVVPRSIGDLLLVIFLTKFNWSNTRPEKRSNIILFISIF
jgi:hypothetical protein